MEEVLRIEYLDRDLTAEEEEEWESLPILNLETAAGKEGK